MGVLFEAARLFGRVTFMEGMRFLRRWRQTYRRELMLERSRSYYGKSA